ncbi:MAG: hypothetical protein CMP59_05060 [Flavobacteriales bacterium]|nr:hypothetical protein [Flavobacteriales bacterium]
MNDLRDKLPKWFWAIAIIGLIWNIMGVMAYLAQVFATPEMIETWPDGQAEMVENRPAWATAAFAIAVWSGFIASIALLMKRRIAYTLFLVSLIGIVIQYFYELFLMETEWSYEANPVVIMILIPLLGIIMLMVSKKAKANGWLR